MAPQEITRYIGWNSDPHSNRVIKLDFLPMGGAAARIGHRCEFIDIGWLEREYISKSWPFFHRSAMVG